MLAIEPDVHPGIMVAEDESALRELLVLVLQHAGFNAFPVTNRREACACLADHKIDLILLDIGLGDESGIDLLKEVRTRPDGSELPILLLTGHADRRTVMTLAQLGVQEYVLKSHFHFDDLLSRINRNLGRKHVLATGSEAPQRTAEAAVPTNQPADLLTPLITRERMQEQIQRFAELKALSPTVTQLLHLTERPDCSLDQLARIIKQDQVISLKVLKIANSVVYSRGEPVDTIHKALSRIGTAQIRQLVSNIAVIDNFNASAAKEPINVGLFWEHSIATGLIAAAITRTRNGDEREIDRAFTAGLLHDVGRLVLAEQLGPIYQRVLDTANRLHLPLDQVESRMLQSNHAELMQQILNFWQFPTSLIEPIAMHHLPFAAVQGASPHHPDEIHTLSLANAYAHAMLLGSSGNDCFQPVDHLAEKLDLNADTIKFIEREIPGQTMEMKCAFYQMSPQEKQVEYQNIAIKQFRQPLRTLYTGPERPGDSFKMLFARLSNSTVDKTPNLSVMNLTNIQDRDGLTNAVLEKEKNAGVAPLPLLVISSFENVKLDSRLLARRPLAMLPATFTQGQLVETVNGLSPAN
ncbi:MAG TPA: HDOD domain-containing protein [Tepidisphaeraceae bacterium]|nr:HDOD domain-containing protein [Tepidisphaeraceae bacterium]